MKRFLLILPFLFLTCEPATASSENRLRLVHMILGEEGWRFTDGHAAILHVLERRRHLPAHQGFTLTQMANEYSAFLKPNPEKNDLPHRTAIYRLDLETAPQWAVRLVDQFLQDTRQIKDPCRGRAWHFGSPQDVLASKRNRVDCGYTHNIFLGLQNKRIQVAQRGSDTSPP
jgi:hypothetical protein